jgi:hypothetical protein
VSGPCFFRVTSTFDLIDEIDKAAQHLRAKATSCVLRWHLRALSKEAKKSKRLASACAQLGARGGILAGQSKLDTIIERMGCCGCLKATSQGRPVSNASSSNVRLLNCAGREDRLDSALLRLNHPCRLHADLTHLITLTSEIMLLICTISSTRGWESRSVSQRGAGYTGAQQS